MGEICWFNAKLGMPMVSVGPSGLTFTPAARVALGDPTFVRIGVDPARKKLCVQPSEEADDHTIEFRSRVDRNGYVRLTQKDITRFIECRLPMPKLERASKYAAVWVEQKELLEVDLAETPTQRRRAQRPRGNAQARGR